MISLIWPEFTGVFGVTVTSLLDKLNKWSAFVGLDLCQEKNAIIIQDICLYGSK